MKSKISSSSITMVSQCLLRYRWFIILYGLALFLTLPLQILFMQGSGESVAENVLRILTYSRSGGYGSFLLIVTPVMAGSLAFRFLHHKSESDLVLSLPVKREALFGAHLIGGFLLFLLPTLLFSLILALMPVLLAVKGYGMIHVFLWTLFNIVIGLILYSLTVFSGMVVGMSTLQGPLAYILSVLPAGLVMLTLRNISYLVYGFSDNLPRRLLYFTPLSLPLKGYYISDLEMAKAFPIQSMLIFSAAALMLVPISHYLFLKRPAEQAGQPVVFKGAQPWLKFLATLCTAMLFSFFFMEGSGKLTWMLVGYALGGLLGYCLAEMIMKKSFRAALALKGFLIFMLVSAALISMLKMDVFGYAKKTVDASDLQSAYFGYGFPYEDRQFYSDKETLQNIVALHKAIVTRRIPSSDGHNGTFVIEFVRKDGSKITRSYSLSERDYEAAFAKVYNSEAVIRRQNPVMLASASDIGLVSIRNDATGEEVFLTDRLQIQRTLHALQMDVLSKKWTARRDSVKARYLVTLKLSEGKAQTYALSLGESILENPTLSISTTKDFHAFNDFLEQSGAIERLSSAEGIHTVMLKKVTTKEEMLTFRNSGNSLKKGDPGVVTLDSPADIQQCMKMEAFYQVENFPAYFIEVQDVTGRVKDQFYVTPSESFIAQHFDS